jgi:hypothetical protein
MKMQHSAYRVDPDAIVIVDIFNRNPDNAEVGDHTVEKFAGMTMRRVKEARGQRMEGGGRKEFLGLSSHEKPILKLLRLAESLRELRRQMLIGPGRRSSRQSLAKMEAGQRRYPWIFWSDVFALGVRSDLARFFIEKVRAGGIVKVPREVMHIRILGMTIFLPVDGVASSR